MTSRSDAGHDVLESDGAAPDAASIPDERLVTAHNLARAALGEITPDSTVGEPVGFRVEDDGVVSLQFATLLRGYPGWLWTVSLARLDDADPTVLEVELLPDDQALLAPEWVPWAERLAHYEAQQAADTSALEIGDATIDSDDEDLDDDDDIDADSVHLDGSPILHSGDVDGVDIDELDDGADESAEDDGLDDGGDEPAEDDDQNDEDDDQNDEDDDQNDED